MNRRMFVLKCGALMAAGSHTTRTWGRVRTVGVLGNARPTPGTNDAMSVFVASLRDLGWSEGQTVAFEYRGAGQRYERFRELAQELVAHEADLIVVTAGVTAALAARQATATIPILAVGVADPVKFGLVNSLARPEGNVTGLVAPLPDWGKYLELAQEAVSGIKRIAVIGNPDNVGYADYASQNEAAARRLGLQLQMIPVSQADDLARGFEAMSRARAEALVFGPDRVFLSNLKEIIERARAIRLPLIAPVRPAAEAGALLSYGLDGRWLYKHAAIYADKLLRGIKPADLPIDQPTRFELVVNARAAQQLGLKISSSIRLRADEVIE